MQLEEILKQYEDFELAFLKKYKYDSYLSGSKKAIDSELNRRHLTTVKLDLLISNQNEIVHKDGKQRCPRCSSLKIAFDEVEYWNTYGRPGYADNLAVYDGIGGKQTYKQKISCMVCDYVIHDPNVGGYSDLPQRIGNFFKKIFGNN